MSLSCIETSTISEKTPLLAKIVQSTFTVSSYGVLNE